MTDIDILFFTVHPPPSTNHLYARRAGRKGVYLAPQYRTWRKEASLIIKEAVCKSGWNATAPYKVNIKAIIKPNRDLDNIIKPILDAIQDAGAIENDRDVSEIRVLRSPSPNAKPLEGDVYPHCIVTISGDA